MNEHRFDKKYVIAAEVVCAEEAAEFSDDDLKQLNVAVDLVSQILCHPLSSNLKLCAAIKYFT